MSHLAFACSYLTCSMRLISTQLPLTWPTSSSSRSTDSEERIAPFLMVSSGVLVGMLVGHGAVIEARDLARHTPIFTACGTNGCVVDRGSA